MNELIITIAQAPITGLIMGLAIIFALYYSLYKLEGFMISDEDYAKGYRLFDRNGLRKTHKDDTNSRRIDSARDL